jgi:Bacterial protein of unknown function (DUF937)
MASGAGISDVTCAQKTISGAAPAILSGLAGVASKPEGARQLSAAIAGLPSNLLGDLAGMIGGSGRLANIGNAALTKLFGSTTLDTLASSVLSMVAPVSLGVLGRETGGTVGALSQFLSSQKDKLSLSAPYHRHSPICSR